MFMLVERPQQAQCPTDAGHPREPARFWIVPEIETALRASINEHFPPPTSPLRTFPGLETGSQASSANTGSDDPVESNALRPQRQRTASQRDLAPVVLGVAPELVNVFSVNVPWVGTPEAHPDSIRQRGCAHDS